MNITNVDESRPAESMAPRVGRSLGTIASVLILALALVSCGLVALNVTTLLSEEAHDVGFDIVQGVLAAVVSDAVLTKMLSKSPTKTRRAAQSTANKLISEKAELSASMKVLEKKHAELKRSHDEIQAKHSELKRVSERRTVAAKDFSKQLAGRVIKNAGRAASTALAKAIPYAGSAVVATVTALDLYDACQIMKSLGDLHDELGIEKQDPSKVCGIKSPF